MNDFPNSWMIKQMKIKIIHLFIGLLFLLFNLFFLSSILAQEQTLSRRANEIDVLIKQKNEIARLQEQKLSDLKKLTAEITELKSKETTNILQNNKLQTKLSQSKMIADDLDSLAKKQNELQTGIQKLATEFMNTADEEILTIFRRAKQTDRQTKEYKKTLETLSHIFQLRAKYSQLISEKYEYPIQVVHVEINKNDSPQVLQSKLDVLKDQEDYLRSLNLVIQNKLNKTSEWQELAQRANDLVEDIQLMQSQDESMYKNNNDILSESIGDFRETSPGAFGQKSLFNDNLILLNPIDLNNLFRMEPEELQQQIKKLQEVNQVVKFKADSLAARIKTLSNDKK